MRMRVCLLGLVTVLLTACGGSPEAPGDAAPAVDESTEDSEVDGGSSEPDGSGQEEPGSEDEADEDVDLAEEDEADEGVDLAEEDDDRETPDTEDAGDVHGADDRLGVALATVAGLVEDDADLYDDHCGPLSAWDNVEAELVGKLDDGSRQDGGWEARGGDLVQFGCGFGWHSQDDEGFGSLAVLVSVYASPAELPAGFEEVSTSAGMPAWAGQGELEDDLVWMSGGPVSAAVTVVGDHELRATSQPDLLEPEELLAVLDAAWEDLGALAAR